MNRLSIDPWPSMWLRFLMGLILGIFAVAPPTYAVGVYNLLDETVARDTLFAEYDVSDEVVVYFHQRMIGEVVVQGDYVNYQYAKATGELLARKAVWREGLPETFPPLRYTRPEAEAFVEGEVLGSRLLLISPESDVFPLEPAPGNPCWVVRSRMGGGLIVSVIDAMTGEFLGYGVPPPFEAVSTSGPTDFDPCDGSWSARTGNAKQNFEAMGYETQEMVWPSQTSMQAHIGSQEPLFFEMGHSGGDNQVQFKSGCVNGEDEEITTASEIETWIESYPKKAFAFFGSCWSMCSTGEGTLSYAIRKGSNDNTTTIGFCGMSADYCESCWYDYSMDWQRALFRYMRLRYSVKEAFDQANADYPVCADNECMRFAGDEDYIVPVTLAQVWHVSASGHGDFPTIQAAINAVADGDTIELADGTYPGGGSHGYNYRGKAITIRSQWGDRERCVIDCAGSGRAFMFNSGEDSESVLEGITIRGGNLTYGSGAAIICNNSSPTIRNCIFEDNHDADYGGAFSAVDGAAPTLTDCVFLRNSAGYEGGAARCWNGSSPEFRGCIFAGNFVTSDAGRGGGVACHRNSQPFFHECTFYGNDAPVGGGISCVDNSSANLHSVIISFSTEGEAVNCDQGSIPSVVCSDFYGNEAGNWVGNVGGPEIAPPMYSNKERDPLFCDPAADDFSLCADSPCLVSGGPCAPHDGALGEGCDDCGGACCHAGACQITTYETCQLLGGTYHSGSNCYPQTSPCEAVCCHGPDEQQCTLTTQSGCDNLSGSWYPDWPSCTGDPCYSPPPDAACCDEDTGACELMTEAECAAAGGTWHSGWDDCTPNPCTQPPTGACCFAEGGCGHPFSESVCQSIGGVYFGDGTSCLPENPCPQPPLLAVCCNDGACDLTDSTQCSDLGGMWHLEWDECVPNNPCPGPARACCFESGDCQVLTEYECNQSSHTVWHEDLMTCDPNPCPQPVRVCCTSESDCVMLTEAECNAQGGNWHGDWLTCDDGNPCPAVCCNVGACSLIPEGDCLSAGGEWHGEGHTCDPNPCSCIIHPDGSGDYATIQLAIDSGIENLILLANGTFTGDGNRDIIYRGGDVTIRSLADDPGLCVIDCEGGDENPHRGFNFISSADSSWTLASVTVTGGVAPFGAAVFCSSASCNIEGCRFMGNRATMHGGALYCDASYPTLHDDTFDGNSATADGGAIYTENGSRPFLTRCTFTGNSGQYGGAICGGVTASPGAEMFGCTFYGNSAAAGACFFAYPYVSFQIYKSILAFNSGGGAIGCSPSATPWLQCCDVFGNIGGDWVGMIYPFLTMNNNLWEDPLFCDPPGDLRLGMNSPCLPPNACNDLIGAWGEGCGAREPETSNLSGGVLIAHHVAEIEYSMTPDPCQSYADFALADCEGQDNRIDSANSWAAVWFVLAGWAEEKRWITVEFGLGDYDDAQAFAMAEWGPCYPGFGIEATTPSWPDPGEGITIEAVGSEWRGSLMPVYWFATYEYGYEGTIPLSPHPETAFAGTGNLAEPPQQWPAQCLGSMGFHVDGLYCCPDTMRACCVRGACSITRQDECASVGGIWLSESTVCNPNPCPDPVAVCCVNGACSVVTEEACDDLHGSWYFEYETCDPNPCPPPDIDFSLRQAMTGLEKSEGIWGDLDGDGDTDMVVAGDTGSGYVTLTYRCEGDTLLLLPNTLIGVGSESSGNLALGDYDGDGDLDLALAGMSASGRVARIYANDGDGGFTWDTSQSLTGVSDASLAWGDVDQDGDLDLLLAGDDGEMRITTLYENDPLGTLAVDAGTALTGLAGGAAAWADWDGDGDVDLLLTGSDGTTARAIFYLNHPCGTLSDDGNHGIPGLERSSGAWGDYDNDGDLDLAVCGLTPTGRTTEIFSNDGSGGLTSDATAAGLSDGACAWADYDNDGDLDLALCGETGSGPSTTILENTGAAFGIGFSLPGVASGSVSWGDVGSDGNLDLLMTGTSGDSRFARCYAKTGGVVNHAPSPPVDFGCEAIGGGLHLFWTGAADAETDTLGLYYSLRVVAASDSNGLPSGAYGTPLMGNVGQATEWTLTLPPDTYTWSVRSVDTGLMASGWSTENTCQVTAGLDYADHNVGNCVLTVTDQGILGFMDGTQTEGSGFVYPAAGSNLLYIGSLWVGNSPTYIANRDYDADPAPEWTVSLDPDGHVWEGEDGISDQDLHAAFTDQGAAASLGLLVHQESWAFADNEVANHHVIINYMIRNESDAGIDSLYAGVFLDLDLTDSYETTGRVDSTTYMAFITDTTGVHAGVCLLQGNEDDPPFCNVSMISNELFVWPNAYVLDDDKYGFLAASDPQYSEPEGLTPTDYSVFASAGPFDLLPGAEQPVAFAIIGGATEEEILMHARVAQLIHFKGYDDAPDPHPEQIRLLSCAPNPFERETLIRFELPMPIDVDLRIYDLNGRLVRTMARGALPATVHAMRWDGRDEAHAPVPGGVYFIRLLVGDDRRTSRVIRLR